MNRVILATVVMGLLGFFFAIVLSYFSKKFEIKKDDGLADVVAALPGVNCGACGCASCEDFAGKFLKGEVPVDGCKAGGKKVAEKLTELKAKFSGDVRLVEVLSALPGVNCGACGSPSCEAFAKAFLKGEQPVDGCKVGREKTAAKLVELKKKFEI
ncbi:hypothetical protein JXA85_00690 [Candidatus Woesearchaeota archaeon]|nr:hypothetical protein [Candidatus Woesearchaeota archaeon]